MDRVTLSTGDMLSIAIAGLVIGIVIGIYARFWVMPESRSQRQVRQRSSKVKNYGNRLANLIDRYLVDESLWVKRTPMEDKFWVHVMEGDADDDNRVISIDIHGYGSGEFGLYTQVPGRSHRERKCYPLSDQGLAELFAEIEQRLIKYKASGVRV